MVEGKSSIAVIPSDCFRWRAKVQFIESFRSRTAALDFAFEHGHNLIVERNEGSHELFDVLQDPDWSCTTDIKLELLTNEEVLVEPGSSSWTLLMLGALWNLARRFVCAIARFLTREVAPRLRPFATRQRWADIHRIFRLAWYRHIHWNIRNLKKRIGSAVSHYRSEFGPQCRRTALRCWWSGYAVDFRRLLHRHLQGGPRDLAKRLPAVMASMYALEVTPRLRQVAIRIRQADFQGRGRRARSIALLKAIRLIDQSVAALASFYVREVNPRLRQAAARYQQADIEGTFRRSIEAVAPPQHSNSSQLVWFPKQIINPTSSTPHRQMPEYDGYPYSRSVEPSPLSNC